MDVVVIAPVTHRGERFAPGASPSVPDTVGKRWVKNGWASEKGASKAPEEPPKGEDSTQPDEAAPAVEEAAPRPRKKRRK